MCKKTILIVSVKLVITYSPVTIEEYPYAKSANEIWLNSGIVELHCNAVSVVCISSTNINMYIP